MNERLHKLIAASGIASRRGAEQLIKEGRVTVNNNLVTEMGTTADLAKDKILVNGKPLPKPEEITYVFYKPRGVVCSRTSQGSGNQKLLTDFLPKEPPVYPIGRLDKESEGLILVSNNGDLTHKVTHPSFQHVKQYLVTAKYQSERRYTPAEIEKKLLAGVKLGDGKAKVDSIRIQQWEEKIVIELEVHEGRHHLIRRMCAAVGLDVTRLTRSKIDFIGIDGLQKGQYRMLTKTETKRLLAQ